MKVSGVLTFMALFLFIAATDYIIVSTRLTRCQVTGCVLPAVVDDSLLSFVSFTPRLD